MSNITSTINTLSTLITNYTITNSTESTKDSDNTSTNYIPVIVSVIGLITTLIVYYKKREGRRKIVEITSLKKIERRK